MTELRTAHVAGATGLIGGHLVKLLLAGPACDKAVVLARYPLHQGQDSGTRQEGRRAFRGSGPSCPHL